MKRVLKNPLVPLLLAVCICVAFGVFMSGDPFPAKEIYGYKPMVCVNDKVYGVTGSCVESPPQGFIKVGVVKEKVSNLKPMVKRNYASNSLEIGIEIFTSRDNLDEIYLKLEKSKYIKYERIVEDDSV